MKDYNVQIRFTSPCLGNAKDKESGRFLFARNLTDKILFLSTWHRSNMVMASKLLSSHQDAVKKIHWDTAIDVELREKRWHRVYYKNAVGRERYSVHESIVPGQIATIAFVLPTGFLPDVFVQLMSIAGKYKGLSPWKPGEYGHYEVVDVFERQNKSSD